MFFVFEWDFRFRETDCSQRFFIPGRQLIPLSVDAYAEPSAAASSGSEPVRAKGIFYEIPVKSAGCCDIPCQEALDLVRICNAASRNGVGDIVWLGWQASAGDSKAKRNTHVNFGTACVAVTVLGGKTPGAAMADGRMERCHIDVALKNWLLKEARTARGSYIIPPVGGSIDHESACDPDKYGNGKRRKSIWQCGWLAQGTRRSEDHKIRVKIFGSSSFKRRTNMDSRYRRRRRHAKQAHLYSD